MIPYDAGFYPEIPNSPSAGTKTVWLQLTWYSTNTVPEVAENDNIGGYSNMQLVDRISLEPLYGSSYTDWYQDVWEIQLPYNPPEETMTIWEGGMYGPAIAVGEVVVDTQCVPEPSTLVLLGIGAISLLAYAWQRRRRAA